MYAHIRFKKLYERIWNARRKVKQRHVNSALTRAIAVGVAGVGAKWASDSALAEPMHTNIGLYLTNRLITDRTSLFNWLWGGDTLGSVIAKAPVFEIDNINHWKDQTEEIRNPLCDRDAPLNQNFTNSNEYVLLPPPTKNPHKDHPFHPAWFVRAGPREKIAFHPKQVKAAIVTCGGLCPGLNTVIQGLVRSLHHTYGVQKVYGIPFGYGGIYTRDWIDLNPYSVRAIHEQGGSFLGSSRGGWNLDAMMDALEAKGINHLYVIGGDGTHRGAEKLASEAKNRGLNLVVAGIPKTIDNDIPYLDFSFGYRTSVSEAIRAIKAANTEAIGAPNCIGLVKVMGRHAGFIAMQASIASRVVNCCLIPEMNIDKEKVLQYLKHRLDTKGHAVVVVAEGAGGTLCSAADQLGVDKSGNPILPDVGLWMKKQIKDYMMEEGMSYNLKYIDPTYMIRSVAADADDQLLCTLLANHAVHGAMAGFSGFTVGQLNHKFVYIPIREVTRQSRKVNTKSRMYCRMLLNTGQPDFTPDKNK